MISKVIMYKVYKAYIVLSIKYNGNIYNTIIIVNNIIIVVMYALTLKIVNYN